MAVLKTTNLHSQTFSTPFLPILLFMAFLSLPAVVLKASATSLSFNFTRFGITDYGQIILERDAIMVGREIQLTWNQPRRPMESFGRAVYAKPLNLWNKASGNVANFTTHFSFVINSLGSNIYGDGLAFFLAPNGSRIPPGITGGGGLGLTSDTNATNPQANQFVAVEFDTYQNVWDPQGNHVGVNVNSMQSTASVSWPAVDFKQGKKTDVWITYDSSQKVLEVEFSYNNSGDNNSTMIGRLSNAIDLASVLPEWVTFGFSAATGYAFEINSICSWEFNAT